MLNTLYDITPFTLLDYPGEMACIVWLAGCNMRCVYCHNPDIVKGKGKLEEKKLFDFLKARKGKLTAVVFSGGEPTLSPALPELIGKVKAMGFKIKLDTNGTRPDALKKLLAEGFLDYVALDYKSPPERLKDITGSAKYAKDFQKGLGLLVKAAQQGLKLEVRTTYHADLMTEDELGQIIHDLEKRGFKGTYYIQDIASHGDKTLGHIAKPVRRLTPEKLPKPKGFKIAFRNFPEEKQARER